MTNGSEEVRVNGKTLHVPTLNVKGRKIVATGKWTKIASVKDEDLFEGDAVDDPACFISALKEGGLGADLFTFAQRLSQTKPKYSYAMEWDNAAVIPLKDYSDWWEKRLSQETRRNVRRASKQGVVTQIVPFTDELVKSIIEIYNETPVRQGKPFWHYGKDFETVKHETATYLDRSEFIGAYHENDLIGFIKLSYSGDCAHIIHILSKVAHADKRPTNALIAKAVEVCTQKHLSFLTYCRYIDNGNEKSDLTEFKRRNGFEAMLFPRYFVPLNLKGKLVLRLRLHHGIVRVLPKRLLPVLLDLRRKFFEFTTRKQCANGGEAA